MGRARPRRRLTLLQEELCDKAVCLTGRILGPRRLGWSGHLDWGGDWQGERCLRDELPVPGAVDQCGGARAKAEPDQSDSGPGQGRSQLELFQVVAIVEPTFSQDEDYYQGRSVEKYRG